MAHIFRLNGRTAECLNSTRRGTCHCCSCDSFRDARIGGKADTKKASADAQVILYGQSIRKYHHLGDPIGTDTMPI